MSGGIVFVVVLVLFIFVIAGFNNEVKSKSEAREQKRISESNAAKIQQLKKSNDMRIYYVEKLNNLLKELQNCGSVEDAQKFHSELKNGLTDFYNKGYILTNDYNTLDKALKLLSSEYSMKLFQIAQKNMQGIKPIEVPEKQEKTKEELYEELKNSVEITEEYYTKLFVVITPEEWSKDYGVISRSNKLIRLERKYFEELERRYQPTKEFNENLSKVCALNNKGIALEKDGNIEEAITTYEECILIPYKAHHSYDRLLVLYRKRKDYENEKRVCLAAIERFPENDKYKERLTKIEAKINKASKP